MTTKGMGQNVKLVSSGYLSTVPTLEEPLERFPVPAEVVEDTAGLAGSTQTASSWVWASGPSSQVLIMPAHPPDPSSGRMDLQKVVRI